MSAAQSLALLRGHAARHDGRGGVARRSPGTSSRASALFIAELPASDGVPTEAELLALGRAAVEVTPDKVGEVARPTALLTAVPKGGAVVESVAHAPSGVTSMWLDNGVRVHHRFMDERKNEATHLDHARRRHDPGDGGGPRAHRGGAARLGPPGDEHAVEHGDPRSDDGREGAGPRRHDGRHAVARRVGRSRRARARAPARVSPAHRPGDRAGRARAVEGRRAAAHRRAEEPADAGAGRPPAPTRSIRRTRRGRSR